MNTESRIFFAEGRLANAWVSLFTLDILLGNLKYVSFEGQEYFGGLSQELK